MSDRITLFLILRFLAWGIVSFFVFIPIFFVYADAPTVSTIGSTSVTETTADLQGSIIDFGMENVDTRGFEYGTAPLTYGTSVTDPSSPFTESYQQILTWGSGGATTGTFDGAQWIAINTSDNVYVADNVNHRIQKFISNGSFLLAWGSNGTGNGEFSFPQGIAIDAPGYVFVADSFNHRIQVFDSEGVFQRAWGSNGTGNGEFSYPQGVAVHSSLGRVYVTDSGNNRIQVFDTDGNYITQWGSSGTGNGEFDGPQGIAVSSSYVYVVDTDNHRIQKFDLAGNYVTEWGVFGTSTGEFSSPFGVALDSYERVYVVDSGNRRIQKFDANGSYITEWGSLGTGDNQFWTVKGIAVDSNKDVYTIDSTNNRVQKFEEQNGEYTLGISSLTCGTTYYFRAYAENVDGSGYGSEESFSTDPCLSAPTITVGISSFDDTSATVEMYMEDDGNEAASDWGVSYGLDGTFSDGQVTDTGLLSTGQYAYLDITGLTCETTYYYQGFATNTAGTGVNNSTFTTDTCPVTTEPTVTTGDATGAGGDTITFEGEITDLGTSTPTERGFEYGVDDTYGNIVSETDVAGYSLGAYSLDVEGLECGETYHYRAFATSADGTGSGVDNSIAFGCTVSGGGGGGSINLDSSGFSSTTSSSIQGCKDPVALNYSTLTVSHNPTLCVFAPGVSATLGYETPSGGISSCTTYGPFTTLVRRGSVGFPAQNVQRAVNQMNVLAIPLTVDGKIGPLSESGIRQAQARLGVIADGLWGRMTQAAYERWVTTSCGGVIQPAVQPATSSYVSPPQPVSQPTSINTYRSPIAMLRYGITSPDVKRLQMLLNRDTRTRVAKSGPGSPGQEFNYFGPETLDAVKRFQSINGLKSDGIVGPATFERLGW